MLADRPDLADVLATMQWEEWGRAAGESLDEWTDLARRDVGRTALPAGFVAIDDDDLLGGVSLRDFDIPQRRDRSPWICGMLVRSDRRGQGVGTALMSRLHSWATLHGFDEAWVWTGSAARFYERCGWTPVESLANEGVTGTVLRRSFVTPVRPDV